MNLLVRVETMNCKAECVLTGLRLKSGRFTFTFKELTDRTGPLKRIKVFPLVQNGEAVSKAHGESIVGENGRLLPILFV